MKLEVGKRYLKRNGEPTGILFGSNEACYPFSDTYRLWTADGFYWTTKKESPDDIVAEYQDPERALDEMRFWAALRIFSVFCGNKLYIEDDYSELRRIAIREANALISELRRKNEDN